MGSNRPTLQFNLRGDHYVVQFLRPLQGTPSEAHLIRDHYARILANDPSLDDHQITFRLEGVPER